MRKIILLCSAGMSTSILTRNMRKEAEKMNYKCTIDAYALSEAVNVANDADFILLGPQVRYQLNTIVQKFQHCPVEAINATDYGMVNGKKIMEYVKNVLGD